MQNSLWKNTQDITFCKVVRESTCEEEMPHLVCTILAHMKMLVIFFLTSRIIIIKAIHIGQDHFSNFWQFPKLDWKHTVKEPSQWHHRDHWNTIPWNMRSSNSIDIFKNHLIIHLFKQAFWHVFLLLLLRDISTYLSI